MKKILFLWSTSFWDRIASIPYLLKMKEEWNDIFLLEYGKWYLNYLHNQNDIYDLYKKNKLYKGLFVIPYNKLSLIKFIVKNFHKFDLAYAPTYTLPNKIWWLLFWKHRKYTFKSLNDDSKYDNFVSWMLEINKVDFYSYSKELKFPYSSNYKNKYWIKFPFVCVFVWPYTWSLKEEERIKIFDSIYRQWKGIILLWWNSKEREWWIVNYIRKNKWIINLLSKTNFEELCSIITDADYTISANWGIMWLCHLLNKKSISFSIVSGNMIHPPVNNRTSFHIHNKVCILPCEMRKSEEYYKHYWYKKCVFKWTNNEWICRNLRWEQIIKFIEIIIQGEWL